MLALLAPRATQPAAAAQEPIHLDWPEHAVVQIDRARELVTARSGIHVRYRRLDVRADELDLDLNTNIGVFRGSVVLEVDRQKFAGDSLTINLATEEWTFEEPQAILPPSFFQRGVRSPVYLSGREADSHPGEILVLGARLTTCNRPEPHYHIESHQAAIYPGQRLVARNVGFFVGRRRLFTIPYFMVSLRQMGRQPFVPQIGQSDLEGKFIKTLFNYEVGARSFGSLHLDLMERRGIGYGVEHAYPLGSGGGRLFLYRLNDNVNDRTELTGRLEHRQPIGRGFDLSLTSDYRHNDAFFAASQTLRNTRVALDRMRPGSTTRLAFADNSIVGLGQFTTQTAGLRHRKYNDKSAWEISTDYQAVKTPLAASDRELETRLAYDDQRAAYDLSLVVQKQFDLDEDRYPGDDAYEVIDRLPEITLRSDGHRLGGALARYLPGQYRLSLGDYRERSMDMTAPRLHLRYDVEPLRDELGGLALDATGLFRQDFYGDPDRTAQYAYGANVRLGAPIGGGWQARLNYLLLERKGFSPFRFDYIGTYRSLTAGIERRTSGSRLSLVAGQDLRHSRWHDLLARADVRVSPSLRMTASTGYDFNRGRPRDFLTRAVVGTDRFRLGVGARCDPNRGEWPRVNTDLDWHLSPKWRLQMLTGYSGTARELLWNEVLLTRDLHCWEARLFYSKQRRLFRIDLRIKAFEWGGYDYGLGRFGQMLDTSVGDLF